MNLSLDKALDLQGLCHLKKLVQLLLGHADLSVVYEVEGVLQILGRDALEVNERVGMGTHRLLGEGMLEEFAARREDDLVGAQDVRVRLIVVGGEGNVKELVVVAHSRKGVGQV